ncbi:MAG: transposase [Chloroflexota bacterium]
MFTHANQIEIILDSFRYLNNNNRLTLHAYVIMDTHVHMIATSANLALEIAKFKSYTARRIIDTFKENNQILLLGSLAQSKSKYKKDRNFQVWMEGSHPQAVQNEEMMRQKIDYIHFNPVKRGLVTEPGQWLYSSAANYEGTPAELDVEINW